MADPRHAIGAAEPVTLWSIAGSTLAVKRWGAGRSVVALHAVGHGSGDYVAFAERVGGDFEVIALDWPGQGRSPGDGGPVDAARYAALLLAAVDALGLDRPIVVGNSIGGAAALIAAAQAPARFAGLVLCNPGGLAPLDAPARFVVGRMAAFFAAGARGAAWFPRAFGLYYRLAVLTAAPAAAQRARIVAAGRQLAPYLADAWTRFGEPDADIRRLVPDVTIPVWLAWAKGDRFVAWRRAKAAAVHLADHTVTLFDGSHAPFLESPDAFAAGFRAFAAGVADE